MKIMIVCSASFYNRVEPIKEHLENKGIEIILPNGYEDVLNNVVTKLTTEDELNDFFSEMFLLSRRKISGVDSILVLNFDKEKNGVVHKNYIGASTFLEMYEAFMQNKVIYMYNSYPDNMLKDEIRGFKPIYIAGDLDKINN